MNHSFYAWQGSVLLIEDSTEVSDLHQQFLERAGCLVSVATTLEEALRAMKTINYDCVVLDLELPDVSLEDAEHGLSIAALREVKVDLPIVVVTGYGQIPETLAEDAAQAWILKPVHPPELLIHTVRCAVAYMAGVTETIQRFAARSTYRRPAPTPDLAPVSIS